MRRIYLIRHGETELMNGSRVCLGGKLDLPLSRQGRIQAAMLARCFEGIPLKAVYCSGLSRSIQTAETVGAGRCPVLVLEGIRELDAGAWEGRDFSCLKKEEPELFEARGRDHALIPPGGEFYSHGAARLAKALAGLPVEEGDIAVVTHAGLNRAFLSLFLGQSYSKNRSIPQEHCCVNVLRQDQHGLQLSAVGILPWDVPGETEILTLWQDRQLPESVRCHSRAVCRAALEMAASLEAKGIRLDRKLLWTAALLHDLCRLEHSHAEAAAEQLRDLGFLRLARIVELHHGGAFAPTLDEAQVLFLADKMVRGEERVSIERRFAESLRKCSSAEALAAHDRRLRQAREIHEKYRKATA